MLEDSMSRGPAIAGLVIAILLLCLPAGISWRARASDLPFIVVRAETEKMLFDSGETVHLAVTARNIGTGYAQIQYFQWPITYFLVYNCSTSRMIFDSRLHSAVVLPVGSFELAQGEALTDEYIPGAFSGGSSHSWDQTDDNGMLVGNGQYEIVGALEDLICPEERSAFIWIGEKGLSVSVKTDSSSYAPGDDVDIFMNITNHGSNGVTLWFPTSLTAYYVIEDVQGDVVYNFKRHVDVLMVLRSLTILPGQTIETSFTDLNAWKQVDDLGNPVPSPAYYYVEARYDSWDWTPTNSTMIVICSDKVPVVDFTYDANPGDPSLIEFNATSSLDLAKNPVFLEARWDWSGDGVWDTG